MRLLLLLFFSATFFSPQLFAGSGYHYGVIGDEPEYIFVNDTFFRICETPRDWSNDTMFIFAYGSECTHFSYVHKPVRFTPKIRNVVIVLNETDSALNLPRYMRHRIRSLTLYSQYRRPLPTDIGEFVNLRELVMNFGTGEVCGQKTDYTLQFPWKPGSIATLKKLKVLHAPWCYIDPLQLNSQFLSWVEIGEYPMSPYVIARLPQGAFLGLYGASLAPIAQYHYRFPSGYRYSTITKVDTLPADSGRIQYNYHNMQHEHFATTFVKDNRADGTWSFYYKDYFGDAAEQITFSNDTVMAWHRSGIYNHSTWDYSCKYFCNSSLWFSESTRYSNGSHWEAYHFSSGSTVVVRDAMDPDTVIVKLYRSGEKAKVVDEKDEILNPYREFMR